MLTVTELAESAKALADSHAAMVEAKAAQARATMEANTPQPPQRSGADG